MRKLFKRCLTALRCRWHGHQLHFVRTTSHDERLFYCHCCKQRFTLCRQGWHRYSDATPHHGH